MTVLVLELNSFHLELFPMYRRLLPALLGERPDIRYFVLPGLAERARDIVGPGVQALNPSWLRFVVPSKSLRARYYQRRVQHLVDVIRPHAVVFNTIEPAPYLQVFRHIQHPLKVGIVHNPRREGMSYETRSSEELVFCLHDYNYRLLAQDKPVDGYLSPFFKYRNVDAVTPREGPLEIAVQGIISFNRRDYPFLISLAERIARGGATRPIVFNILGDARRRDGPRLRRLVADHGLDQQFRFHVGLPDGEFFDQLCRATYLMPLLNAQSDSYAGAAKVTAAYGHSGAYGIPMILHRDTAHLWEIGDDACLAFDGFVDLADRLAQDRVDRAALTTRYQQLISQKIRRNERMLETIAREHPALASQTGKRAP